MSDTKRDIIIYVEYRGVAGTSRYQEFKVTVDLEHGAAMAYRNHITIHNGLIHLSAYEEALIVPIANLIVITIKEASGDE